METSNELIELNGTEMHETNGGWFWPIVAGAAIYEIISDWDNFKAGLMGEPEIK